MTKTKLILIIILITLLGGFLRFYKNYQNPVSLTVDEVAFGYNAYSVLKTGRDEYGKFMPLTFKSVGDYKNPFPIYSMVPSIAIFGLNEFSVRFPTALISTLSIPLFFLLFRKLTKKTGTALLGTLLLAISPWHIYFSRYVSDHLMAGVFIGVGIIFFLKMLDGKKIWALLSALFFVLSIYTYYPERLFVPLFLLALFAIKFKELINHKKESVIFIIACIVLAAPLLYSTFFGNDIARANMVFITKDIEFTRNVLLSDAKTAFSGMANMSLLFFFWARKYLAYFSPSFLFYGGLPMTIQGSYGLGVLYLFEAITLPLGIYAFIKGKIPQKGIITSWILLGLIPSSLTNNEQHPGRTILILPAVILLSALGLYELIKLVKNITIKYVKYFAITAFSILVIWDLAHALIAFSVYFPKERDEDFMNGTKEAVEYMLQNQDKYKEIVFDPYRGVVAPYIVSIPHMYILFYSQYDPNIYQTELKRTGDDLYGFGKYTIRKINWPVDRSSDDILFIGSPWVLNEKDIDQGNILKKIYLENGSLAFLIVRTGD
ncbi:MAG: hypothetical protein UU02_C0037G0003 [Candidatus Woesebacteria bacterium GW2011_GWA1_40_43]|uniref:ArnT-like N-terminal domain-containing protein n=1 Tax=Candidatus Woesebacteria bacterium GW2011_GWA1_40_43 TaxID=1618553 RepID=A0A0G0UTJ6_9BACT|nr:MAG: hypothetical protein UT88_C0033G0009 [Candidatus Woesebacteria bacterium GW2011_GWD2_40_19]KKR58600.1 MAG: hypothetical protein UT96_C0002G0003 [Candidatus Woesebacteria bacterium GW2011_GWC2_40_30]KKR62990.1 MAG: hypothetical protein UU02_C0037G0003 [Candidatus Woesebacteria bacterium GW2011_GWA1_40_43]HAU65294.1 hypothetical protein [Candidatus Woesebacteria bacterium]HCC09222.1 hypothetical protein [Candidatus Woesebacteria bacterium]